MTDTIIGTLITIAAVIWLIVALDWADRRAK